MDNYTLRRLKSRKCFLCSGPRCSVCGKSTYTMYRTIPKEYESSGAYQFSCSYCYEKFV